MEQIAIISDIHGNVPALKAVLDEIKKRNITRIFCLGDLVGKGPSSDIVIDICREKCEKIIKGNWEEAFLSKESNPVIEWHINKLGEARLNFLHSLENCIELKMSGKNIRLFHASQIGVNNRVYKNDPKEKHLAMFDNTEFTGYSFIPDIIGYGDIHSSYKETLGEKILFNVGSVGNPLDITKASFGIITGEYDSFIIDIEIIKVDYDKEKSIDDAKKCNLIDIDLYINEIIFAKYRGVK
jgi:predicted phosphodiesterase